MHKKLSLTQFVLPLIVILIAIALVIPMVTSAFPYGGQISQIIFCYNNAIFARTGAPRGGDFIWTPSTRTYQFGPPSHVGQWHLGLAGPPYYCVVSIEPVIVWPGILITMMGSSGPSSPPVAQPSPSAQTGWKYPQFTSGQQYDDAVKKLRDQYVACISGGSSSCGPLTDQADAMAAERVQRFGLQTIPCIQGVNCVVN